MQVRIDPANAKRIKRNSEAHRRIFKRTKPYAAIVNEILSDVFRKNDNHRPSGGYPVSP